MSGGFSSHATKVLRDNRSLLKKRNFKDIKNLVIESSGKTELEFKQVSAREMFNIKMEIRRKAKKAARVEIAIYIGCTIVTLGFFYWLIYM